MLRSSRSTRKYIILNDLSTFSSRADLWTNPPGSCPISFRVFTCREQTVSSLLFRKIIERSTLMIRDMFCLLQRKKIFFWLWRMLGAMVCHSVYTNGEYAKIDADVEYTLLSINLILGDANHINSLPWCAELCMRNALCLTANYYPLLATCRLFSGDNSRGTRQFALSTQVISMVDRSKLLRKKSEHG